MKLVALVLLFLASATAGAYALLAGTPTALVSQGGCGAGCACAERYVPPAVPAIPATMVSGALVVEAALLALAALLLVGWMLATGRLRLPRTAAAPAAAEELGSTTA